MTALWVSLVALALALVWAAFDFVVRRDRGQVDAERTFISGDAARPETSAVMYVGPRTWENMKRAVDGPNRCHFGGEPIPTMFPDVFLGMPVHVSDALKSRTRW